MKKISILIVSLVFAFGIVVPNALAGEQAGMKLGKLSAFSSMAGTSIVNPKGEHLGKISDVVIDSKGQVAFAVVSHGGFLGIGEKEVAVPFGSLSCDREAKLLVLDATTDKLNMAPKLTKGDLYDEKRAEEVYRYFGKAPYWTEGELVEEEIKPIE
jgi:sporulation protein YlmC with PRC-barrel domain